MEIEFILVLFAAGAVGGFLAGLLGVGGGIIFVPVVTYFLQDAGLASEEEVRYILANSLATILCTGLVSSFSHWRKKNLHPKLIVKTALPAMLSSLVITYFITSVDWYSADKFNVIFLILMIIVFARFLFGAKIQVEPMENVSGTKLGITGFLTGVVSAISGLGGGIILIPMFNYYVKLDMKKASGISIGTIPMMLLPSLFILANKNPAEKIGAMQLGYLDLDMILPMAAGVLFLSPIGVAAAHRMKNRHLQIIFAALVLIIIIKYAFKVFYIS